MRFILACLVMLLAISGAQAADATALDAILTGLGQVRHVEARYVERRFLRVLRVPLETRGVLRFDAPDRLEKASDLAADGAGERIVVAAGVLTLERGAGPPVVLALREHPEIGVLVESVRAMLAGDGGALRRDFAVDLAGDLTGWQVVLTPRVKGLVRWLRVDGAAARLTRIETQENDGDRAELTIGEDAR